MALLEKIGGVVLANACGPCIGQWHREGIKSGDQNTIVSSYNRNFPGRNDGNRATLSFLASPEMVTAVALSGSLSFDPICDKIKAKNGKEVELPIPSALSLPEKGFKIDTTGFLEPPKSGTDIHVEISSDSDRIALL